MKWWERDEYAEVIGDIQISADGRDISGSDLVQVDAAIASMLQTPLGEPPADFNVRCIYDSRPINGYDFNFSSAIADAHSGAGWTATFIVPNGYRAIPRKWSVGFDEIITGPAANSTATIEQGGAALPNNGPIIIGMGTDQDIETFFLCEENTTFGIVGANTNATGAYTGFVNVYGNLIPVTDVALPLSVANQKLMGSSGDV